MIKCDGCGRNLKIIAMEGHRNIYRCPFCMKIMVEERKRFCEYIRQQRYYRQKCKKQRE